MSILPTPRSAYKEATKTLEAIDAAILAKAENGFRPHLGASQIGKPCERALWLSFRWTKRASFPARVLRVFARGHREEANLTALLESSGIKVSTFDPATGKQYRLGGAHFSGSCDGMADGVPESPRVRHIVEYKTSNAKEFGKLRADGVRKAKPEHYDQMQCYMRWAGLTRALYVAVCKDDDRIHAERVRYDKEHAERAIARGRAITLAERMPPPISTDPTWYQCRFCPAHAMCHKSQPTKGVNCRTCAHSSPERTGNGSWSCAKGLPMGQPCKAHLFNPYAMPWEVHDATPDWVEYVTDQGEVIRNEENSEDIAAKWMPF